MTAIRAFAPTDTTGAQNMLQLVQLRWLAIAGQCATILVTRYAFGFALPLAPMLAVLAGLALLNAISLSWLHWRRHVANTELFAALVLDVAGLSAQLYLSGGATNPFVSLFLLQVVLGSVLLKQWSVWILVAITSAAFALLTVAYRPLALPAGYTDTLFQLHVQGMWVCFALVAVLLVLFVSRINGNLRSRDARLAAMQRQTVEEDHIVRIGLLASGAAHELGTPLSSLSVILGDWRHLPRITADPELVQELSEMQAEVRRCKAIVTGILLSAGETRGESSGPTTVREFFDRVIAQWRETRGCTGLNFHDRFGADLPIASDAVLQQALGNVLDNAAEVSPDHIDAELTRDGDDLTIVVTDRGPGFLSATLAAIGTPYTTTKPRHGGGMGLFLVANVLRKLGGTMRADNRVGGGAQVTLRLPLKSLALHDDG